MGAQPHGEEPRSGVSNHAPGTCCHPSRRRYAAPQDEVILVGTFSYCACLIAQVTLTVTDSVSSPCATGVAAIGAAILARKIGPGEPPPSEMLSGAPRLTPAALA